jgi:hypothetical protein
LGAAGLESRHVDERNGSRTTIVIELDDERIGSLLSHAARQTFAGRGPDPYPLSSLDVLLFRHRENRQEAEDQKDPEHLRHG